MQNDIKKTYRKKSEMVVLIYPPPPFDFNKKIYEIQKIWPANPVRVRRDLTKVY